MDDTPEVGASLPAPPHYYTRYTPSNLRLLDQLRSGGPETVADEPDVPTDFDLNELEPPNVEWIVEEGGYASFGDGFPLPPRTMTLPEAGLIQLYPADAKDRRPALRSLLRTMLHTYYSLLTALLQAPPLDQDPAQGDFVFNYTEWIRLAAINMMDSINGLRRMQARLTLGGILTNQLETRRAKVAEVREKCESLRESLVKLREKATRLSNLRQQVATAVDPLVPGLPPPAAPGTVQMSTAQSFDALARWVDEIQ